VTMLLSHASDGAVEVTLLWRDVDAESCWRQGYRVMLVTVPQLKVVLVMVRLWAPELRASRCCHIVRKSDIHVGS
jgi:hypothetical protein